MKKQIGYTSIELIVAIIGIAMTIGWVWNIVKIAGTDFGHITGIIILRVIGVFVPPVGGIVGYL